MRISVLGMLLGSGMLFADTSAFSRAMSANTGATSSERDYFASQESFELEDRSLVGAKYLYDMVSLTDINIEITPENGTKGDIKLSKNEDTLKVSSGIFTYGYRAVDWAYFFNLGVQVTSDVKYSATDAKLSFNPNLAGKAQLKDLTFDIDKKNSYTAGFDVVRFFPQASMIIPYIGAGFDISYGEFGITYSQEDSVTGGAIASTSASQKEWSIVPKAIFGAQFQIADSLLLSLGGQIATSVIYNERMGSYDITSPADNDANVAEQKYTLKPKTNYNSLGVSLGIHYQL